MAIGQQARTSTGRGAPPAPPKPQLVSMSTASFTAGGLIDDIDVEITDVAACTFDWNGSAPQDTPALAIEFTDMNGAQHQQYYALGKPEDWQPSEDGTGFVSVSGKTGIVATTNLGMFLQSLVECNFPDDRLADGNLKEALIGLKCHVIQKQTERKGLVRVGKNADRAFGVLVVNAIHALPGEAVASPKKAGVRAGAKPAPTPGKPANNKANGATTVDDNDVDAVIAELLLSMVSEADGNQVAKKLIAPAVSKHFGTPELQKLRNKAVTRSVQPDFLKSLTEQGMTFDGAVLSLG